jgi:hypothetical protein
MGRGFPPGPTTAWKGNGGTMPNVGVPFRQGPSHRLASMVLGDAKTWLWLIVLAMLILHAHAVSQDEPPGQTPAEPAADEAAEPVERPGVSKADFEADEIDDRWSARDDQATLAITREPAHVASGRGALEFVYSPRQGVFEQIGFGGLAVDGGDTLSVKVKATSPASVSLGIEEQNGAMYQGLLWIDAGKWVTVETRLDELILAETSTDDNGRPDADQIRGFFLADLANLPGETGRALGLKEGEQRLWLDDLEVSSKPKARSRSRVERLGDEWLLVVDGFEDDVPWVLPIREAGLKLVNGAPKAAGRRALEMTYSLGKGRWVGFVSAPPGRLDLAAGTEFHMWAKTALSARLVVVLEERDLSKYETAAKVDPDDKWHSIRIPLQDFLIDDDAPDENDQLDIGQVHRLIVLVDTFDADVTPAGTGAVALDDIGIVMPTRPEGVE